MSTLRIKVWKRVPESSHGTTPAHDVALCSYFANQHPAVGEKLQLSTPEHQDPRHYMVVVEVRHRINILSFSERGDSRSGPLCVHVYAVETYEP